MKALLGLADIEAQIVDIRRQILRKERVVAAQEKKLSDCQRSAVQKQAELRQKQMQFDAVDLDVKSRTGHVNRLREQLNTVRTNKEYAAILSQLNTEKADITRIETGAMELMGGIDNVRAELTALQRTETDLNARLAELRADLDQTSAAFRERLQRLQAQRDAAAAGVPPEVVKTFGRLSERYDGECLAQLVRQNPRSDDYVCGGCFMSLRVEVANALRIRDDVMTCGQCGRILYFPAEH